MTGFGLQLVDFVEDDSGGSIGNLVDGYMDRREGALPNGILVFCVGDDDRAKINRAYARQIPAPYGLSNAFVSPYLGDGYKLQPYVSNRVRLFRRLIPTVVL